MTLQWPYTYDSCDVGTVGNQTKDDLPALALTSGVDESSEDDVRPTKRARLRKSGLGSASTTCTVYEQGQVKNQKMICQFAKPASRSPARLPIACAPPQSGALSGCSASLWGHAWRVWGLTSGPETLQKP